MKKLTWLTAFFLAIMVSVVGYSEQAEAKPKTYTITPTKKPLDGSHKFKNYNSSTKHYYLLKSYMEKIEKNGGGTLVLKKGTYTVSNVISIPSNTTIKLENGAVLKKGMTAGKASFKSSSTLMQVVTPKNAGKKGSMKKHSGAKNIKIIGSGKAVIDLNNGNKATAINMAHVNNVTVSGIEFKNNNNATMIHVVGSKKVTLTKNKFLNAKKGTKQPTIRIETAAKTSSVYPMSWSANDKTVNSGITISSNTFTAQPTAIRTSDYVKSKYQTGIVIDKNKFSKMTDATIVMTGWDKPRITSNSFDDTKTKVKDTIEMRAVSYPVVKSNTFKGSKNIIEFNNFTSNKKLISKSIIKLSSTNKKDLATNQGTKLGNYFLLLPDAGYVALKNNDPGVHNYYEFSSKTKSLNPAYENYKDYNSSTKSNYVLRSIFERLEMQGGGKVKIKKGTYLISKNLYVPSNVEIEFESGAILKKSTSSGSVFQLVPPSKSSVKSSMTKYSGAKNIKFIGKGTAAIDLNNQSGAVAINMAHTSNVSISGIEFKNNNNATVIHVYGSSKVSITKNKFLNAKAGTTQPTIRLETTAKTKAVYTLSWSANDNTVNDRITISGNTFTAQPTAIRTSDYVKSKYQKAIVIDSNKFSKMTDASIVMTGWDKPTITKNTFDDTNAKVEDTIEVRAVSYPTFKSNTFTSSRNPIAFKNFTSNDGTLISKSIIKLSSTNKNDLATNEGTKLGNYFLLLHDDKLLGIKNNDPGVHNHYTFNEDSKVVIPSFENYSTYTKETHNYYVLRSILELLEVQGGGKLKIEKGTYLITNTLFIPSNVEIELEDGVILKKALTTGTSKMQVSNSIFHLVPPSKGDVAGSVGGYNGTQNVKIFSTGEATMDLNNRDFGFAFIMGHNLNVTIENLKFINANGGHYIELDASKNVTISNSKFIGNKVENDANSNEAINLDTPDKITKGFNSIWSNFDRTANENITIKNSHFEDLVTAIGTHQMSGELPAKNLKSMPHKNVQILNNTFKTMRSDAVHAFNWDRPIIQGNRFEDVAVDHRGILSSGSYYPTFKNNHFENLDKPMIFYPKTNINNGTEYEVAYNLLNEENEADLKTNTGKNLQEYDIKIYSAYQDFTNVNRKIVDIQKLDVE